MLHPLWPGPDWLHPHLLFEALAYLLGFRLFLALRRRQGDPVGDVVQRGWVVVGAALGAALGSRALAWAVDPAALMDNLRDPAWWMTRKTIVGGLLGGWLGVELTKTRLGLTTSTGDLFVPPLLLAMAVGRLGCFFSGVSDGTHGVETDFILGMDLGDGLTRHPTALYEVGVLGLMAGVLALLPSRRLINGDRFRVFLALYLAWRLFAETLKPPPTPYLGLSAIQVAAFAALGVLSRDLWRIVGQLRRTS
ncbi:MAG: prolipoprotein diacylglyceryl transferase [Alphaproteobacteria bacterium]|nr:prolipoprotein diacylglyceryl transferase [Alphaproteobacteria bacterium]